MVAAAKPEPASAEAKAYDRTAISIPIRLSIVSRWSVVRPTRSIIGVASMTAMAVMAMMPALGAYICSLLRHAGRRFRLRRIVRGICSGTTEQRCCTDGEYDS